MVPLSTLRMRCWRVVFMSVEGPWWKYVSDWRTIKSASWEEVRWQLKQISAENEKEDARTTGLCSWKKKDLWRKFLKGWRGCLLRRRLSGNTSMKRVIILTAAFEETAKLWKEKKVKPRVMASESIDVTLPGRPVEMVTVIFWPKPVKKSKISFGMDYQVMDSFEVEQDYYNFERMNLPKDHPARDMQDYLLYHRRNLASDPYLTCRRGLWMRMFSKGPWRWSLRAGFPSGYSNCDPTATKFHQMKGAWSLGRTSQWRTERFNWSCKKMFGAERQIRLRPSYSHLPSHRLRWTFLS